MSNEINSIYYTFSTIAQVLAGFIALSGVFVIFKIQELKRQLLFHANRFKIMLGNGYLAEYAKGTELNLGLIDFIETENPEGMLSSMSHIVSQIEKKFDKLAINLEIILGRCNEINFYLKELTSSTKKALIIGVITIIYSMLTLIFAQLINQCHPYLFYLLGIVGTICSILTMTRIIIICLKN